MLSIAAVRQLAVHHFDVDAAYLHANLDHEVLMRQPPGFEEENGAVWRLRKAVYGLKQSGRCWNQCLNEALVKLGFKRSVADPCLYTKGTGNKYLMLLIFVDDLLVAGSSTDEIQKLTSQLEKRFKFKALGPVSNYLEVEVRQEADGSFLLSQKEKILHLIEQFGMENCKPVQTPMTPDFPKTVCDDEFDQPELYHSKIGSLLYLSQWSRPDIACATNVLSQRVSKPSTADWCALKRLIRYLKGTLNVCLKISSTQDEKLEVFFDVDWGSCVTTRKSTSGMVMMFANSIIGWKSKKQGFVATSSCEAEYGSLSLACNEIIWFIQILKDLDCKVDLPIQEYEDSQSCIALAGSEIMKSASKHIAIRHANLRDCVQNGVIKLEYCQSHIADLFTKPLPATCHNELMTKLGLCI
ncbi:uncharacterized protein LOC128409424 [Podarcis raffonei]|uniref:uncharacterized protein LOC128409424 n=1 Tax=Podarcis raffonei TaxID=65483 RepID=UPI0023294724|nr:uncharacterized protein LOC128409424 [Podarcis raffonei]